MIRGVFSRLCFVLQTSGGLKFSRNTSVEEQVIMFLSIFAHHTKNKLFSLINDECTDNRLKFFKFLMMNALTICLIMFFSIFGHHTKNKICHLKIIFIFI
ncbi:hypothetical protein ACS0TY_029648 [Phlomoides rotata]